MFISHHYIQLHYHLVAGVTILVAVYMSVLLSIPNIPCTVVDTKVNSKTAPMMTRTAVVGFFNKPIIGFIATYAVPNKTEKK